MKDYKKENIPLVKTLRKNMTPWERKLWYDFLRSYPVRFQRQKAIGSYIVDFYCAKARLVVELDGGGHYTEKQAEKDESRTKALESMILKVVRICNLDIGRNFRGVCEYIDLTVKNLSLSQLSDSPRAALWAVAPLHAAAAAALTAPSSEGALGASATIHDAKNRPMHEA